MFTSRSLKIDHSAASCLPCDFWMNWDLSTGGIILGTATASMILRKHEQSVLQSLCSIGQHFLEFFVSLYAIRVHRKCAKQNKTNAIAYVS